MFETIFGLLADIGLGHPLSRTVAFAAVGFGTQYLLKPSISYIKLPAGKGNAARAVPKDFAMTSSSAASTYFPWFAWPLVFAIVGGLFI